MEARTSGFDRAGDIVELHLAQDSVGKWPRRNLFVRDRLQVMPFDNGFPDRFLVGHVNGKRRRDRISDGHIEHGGNTRPEMSPAKVIAVGYVEDLASGGQWFAYLNWILGVTPRTKPLCMPTRF
jgi:hypothetical protein